MMTTKPIESEWTLEPVEDEIEMHHSCGGSYICTILNDELVCLSCGAVAPKGVLTLAMLAETRVINQETARNVLDRLNEEDE